MALGVGSSLFVSKFELSGSSLHMKIRLRELRQIYMLIHECCAMGTDGFAWRLHLIQQVRRLCKADFGVFYDCRVFEQPGSNIESLRPTSIVDDWGSEAGKNRFWSWLRRERVEHCPFQSMLFGHQGVRVARRCDFSSDDDWYRSSFFRSFLSCLGFDDTLVVVCRTRPESLQLLTLHRIQHRSRFSRRYVHLLRLMGLELQRFSSRELCSSEHSVVSSLPSRMAQALALLMTGYTVKEIAEQMQISPHTAQEYVKRLKQRAGSNNRVELFKYFRHAARIFEFLESNPASYSENRRRIKKVTRDL